jgi:hypothetical protein
MARLKLDLSNLTADDYLNRQPPPTSAWSRLQLVLALVGVLVLVRLCFHRCRSWFTSSSDDATSSGPVGRLFDHRGQGGLTPGWAMDDDKHGPGAVAMPGLARPHADFKDLEIPRKASTLVDPARMASADVLARSFMNRPPPAPPLTPPELSTTIFNFDDRPRSRPSSRPSFIHQPNPDYSGSGSTSVSQGVADSQAAPKRRSYNKTLPIGIPTPQTSSTGQDSTGPGDETKVTFSPSSYPPSSPILPPAPPGSQTAEHPEHGGSVRNIDVKGEIISVLDREGAGWTRHTRVYGGGVCLACAAAGNREGGFYGANVTPEEMR